VHLAYPIRVALKTSSGETTNFTAHQESLQPEQRKATDRLRTGTKSDSTSRIHDLNILHSVKVGGDADSRLYACQTVVLATWIQAATAFSVECRKAWQISSDLTSSRIAVSQFCVSRPDLELRTRCHEDAYGVDLMAWTG
jgi:hypothetical protein